MLRDYFLGRVTYAVGVTHLRKGKGYGYEKVTEPKLRSVSGHHQQFADGSLRSY